MLRNLTLLLNRSRSTHGHHLNNYDKQETPMLHTRLQGNQFAGSVEDNFEGFLPYMGMATILVM